MLIIWQVPPFAHGLLRQALNVWQLVPVNPVAQLHVYVEPVPVAVHIAPFKHGLVEQAFES